MASMAPEKRKLFFLIAILAAAAGSYMEVLRHEKLDAQKARPAPSTAPATPPANPTH